MSSASAKTLRRSRAKLGDAAATAFAWAGVGEFDARKYAERSQQAQLLRDLFGNPFRPVTFAAEWRTDNVVALAAEVYESRDFSAMPTLADALQDAGCDNDDILSHCRDPQQTHVRGCWVTDLVLGKE